jgi:hypothetical protein
MATQTLSLPAYLSGDADFRTWGKGVSDAIAATGLVKSADTGQIDWTTVARPAANGVAGYEIWKFTDAMQATLPVFIKLEYGTGAAADRPQVAVTVGTGTNGAGAINGQANTRNQLLSANSKANGDKLATYISGNGRGLAVCTNLDPTTSGFSQGVIVGRTVDATGTPTADGIVTYSWRSGSSQYQVIPAAGSVPAGGQRRPAGADDGRPAQHGRRRRRPARPDRPARQGPLHRNVRGLRARRHRRARPLPGQQLRRPAHLPAARRRHPDHDPRPRAAPP